MGKKLYTWNRNDRCAAGQLYILQYFFLKERKVQCSRVPQSTCVPKPKTTWWVLPPLRTGRTSFRWNLKPLRGGMPIKAITAGYWSSRGLQATQPRQMPIVNHKPFCPISALAQKSHFFCSLPVGAQAKLPWERGSVESSWRLSIHQLAFRTDDEGFQHIQALLRQRSPLSH